ncbi:PKD repeat protein [Aquimarina sp. MAR_2010_214]|uniref:PKD domain-containing protein n=1 Tax=Aquimarina sp. MAR_2010_214 TaxID=1250026 RepID=UPI000C70F9F6|nr:PKD domain-containing protein [Aquimarina sp. MAR_2010_214]PKV50782.1 PKD repeat protein [Aquimarina sp. MAR_2010_214]
MNKIIYILSIFCLFGCAKEEAIPVITDFEFEVFNDDFSIPVQVVFFNRTKGGEDYEWTFEGGVPSRSVNRNPGVIQYDAKGVYSIELTATNQDGSQDTKVLEIKIDDPVIVDFEMTNQVDTFSPAKYTFQNKSSGADSFSWTFEGGIPANSTKRDPGEVVFTEPGNHVIRLEIGNGRETYDLQKSITVAPFLISDFEYQITFADDDFQIPARVQFQNNSISATSYQWTFGGAATSSSIEENPEIIFTQEGIQTIRLTASNGKETKTITKQIEFFKNTNLRELNDIKFGINTAHAGNTRGSFYNIAERKLYTANEITPDIGPLVDLVFFGLSSTFNRNRFVSPDQLSGTTFDELQNPKNTIFINSQELCNCSASLTPAQFDTMQDDSLLKNLVITETPGGLQDFNNTMVPRIVLFQTKEGKKGAIKIKSFVDDGQNSYILVDIKVQKE